MHGDIIMVALLIWLMHNNCLFILCIGRTQNDMGQNIELQRVVVTKLQVMLGILWIVHTYVRTHTHVQEAETKVKELEAQVTGVNKSKDKMLQNVRMCCP